VGGTSARESAAARASAAARESAERAPDAKPARRTAPKRRCIVSRAVHPKQKLIRFVVGPDQTLVADLNERLPGRGFWLSARRDALQAALKRGLFAKAARAPVQVPEDLAERLTTALRRRCLELLGLARRAGLVTLGFERVHGTLAAGRAAVLIQAGDAAEGGRHKLAALARATLPDLPQVESFTAEELGRALGRDQAVHLALAPGGLTTQFLAEHGRLRGLLDETPTPRPLGRRRGAAEPGPKEVSL